MSKVDNFAAPVKPFGEGGFVSANTVADGVALPNGAPDMGAKPENVPETAQRRNNIDGSTSWVWEDAEGFNTYTVNCPPTTPIYHDPCGSVPTPPSKTSLETFLVPGAALIPVCSIRSLAASFEAVVVSCGVGVSAEFLALVVRREINGPVVVWNSPCRSQTQAKTESENACRSFAANHAYLS